MTTGVTSGIKLPTAEVFVAEGAKIVIVRLRAKQAPDPKGRVGAKCPTVFR